MNILLLSGGSGKRLWPLSDDTCPKQFLPVFQAQDGEMQSMLARACRKLRLADPEGSITIAAPKAQERLIRAQLSAQEKRNCQPFSLCLEPCGRDTFPAIALACTYLHDIQGLEDEVPVVIVPVDAYAETDYYEALKELSALAESSDANLTLLGIKPDYPSDQYGYILPQDTSPARLRAVRSFTEKPDRRTAEELISQGALWNGGVAACRLGYLLATTREQTGLTSYEDLLAGYENLPSTSFDHAVIEREPLIRVLEFDGVWKDAGTWTELSRIMAKEAAEPFTSGKVRTDETCARSCLINHLDIPVVALGLTDAVVVATESGILIADKERSAAIRAFLP